MKLLKQIISVFAFLFLIACNNEDEVKILFTGDILLSRNVKEEIDKSATNPWIHLINEFKSSDLVIGNLEGAVGDNLNHNSINPIFSIDSNDILLLKNAGFHALSIENNHSLDLGINGYNNTIESLNNQDLSCINFNNSPYFFNIKQYTISVIAINTVIYKDSSKYLLPSIKMMQKIKLAQQFSNLVIITIHWGSELLSWPNNEQRNYAHWLTKNGADVIIGHHPHVVQAPELVNGKVVYFSLGNHLFDQKYPLTKTGLIADLRIKNKLLYFKGITTQTAKKSFYPSIVQTQKKYFPPLKLSDYNFVINNINLQIKSDFYTHRKNIVAFNNQKKIWESHLMDIQSVQKIKINGEEYLFTLENHFSPLDKEINIRPYVYKIDKNGITAKWRGSALAWPIVDAKILSQNHDILCALHRGDSFISLNKMNETTHIKAYKWNGFGFNLVNNDSICNKCKSIF